MKIIASDEDTALLVIGKAEDDPDIIIVRIDERSGEQLAYVRLTQKRAKDAINALIALIK
jgi:CHASE2 domain-containing sensor protein